MRNQDRDAGAAAQEPEEPGRIALDVFRVLTSLYDPGPLGNTRCTHQSTGHCKEDLICNATR